MLRELYESIYRKFVLSRIQRDFSSLVLTTPIFYGPKERVHIDEGVDINNTLFNLSSGNIFIEKDVIIGHNVALLTGRHEFAPNIVDRRVSRATGCDICVGKNAWIASNCTVLGPVKIGNHAVLCAGSVVTKDVPSWTMVAGVPAKTIKYLKETRDE